jgi:hypothetical protein
MMMRLTFIHKFIINAKDYAFFESNTLKYALVNSRPSFDFFNEQLKANNVVDIPQDLLLNLFEFVKYNSIDKNFVSSSTLLNSFNLFLDVNRIEKKSDVAQLYYRIIKTCNEYYKEKLAKINGFKKIINTKDENDKNNYKYISVYKLDSYLKQLISKNIPIIKTDSLLSSFKKTFKKTKKNNLNSLNSYNFSNIHNISEYVVIFLLNTADIALCSLEQEQERFDFLAAHFSKPMLSVIKKFYIDMWGQLKQISRPDFQQLKTEILPGIEIAADLTQEAALKIRNISTPSMEVPKGMSTRRLINAGPSAAPIQTVNAPKSSNNEQVPAPAPAPNSNNNSEETPIIKAAPTSEPAPAPAQAPTPAKRKSTKQTETPFLTAKNAAANISADPLAKSKGNNFKPKKGRISKFINYILRRKQTKKK